MKRDLHQFQTPDTGFPNHGTATHTSSSSKDKMMMVKEEDDGDELLAMLGYKVKSSEMAEVALKLEQLETMMGNVQEDGLLSNLATDTVHYNPSELYSWLDNMLTEFNPPPPPPEINSSFLAGAASDYDLKAIPGNAIYARSSSSSNQPCDNNNNNSKRLKSCSSPDSLLTTTTTLTTATESTRSMATESTRFTESTRSMATESTRFNESTRSMAIESTRLNESTRSLPTESTRSMVLVDSQENGVRLVHALMACAEAVQSNDLSLAEALVKQIGFLAVSQAGAMRKVATYFAEALARRIYRLSPPRTHVDHSLSDTLQTHFYETCPYLKFAHFTANQAILEAFEGKKRVHVIDFSMSQGLQWPALMQALALREGGPPVFRLTGIGPPAADGSDHLHEVGCKLAQLAEAIHVEFEYRGFVASSLADLDATMLELRPSDAEAVAVNSVFELHKLLGRTGGVEKVLSVVKEIKPVIFTVVEQESSHNGPVFLDRFTESLHYYSTLFDSLEGVPSSQDKVMSEVYLGKQICNLVACEGADRVERHETLSQWANRFGTSGFAPAHLGSNAFKQASMLLALFNGGEGYRVEESNGCLMLGWHTRPLITTSAWKLAAAR